MDKRRTKSLDGKCGSCRFFILELGKECTGYCAGRMKQKGRIERTYKCIGYEAAPTIIEAEGGAKEYHDDEMIHRDSILSATIKCGGAVTCKEYVDTAKTGAKSAGSTG